MAIIECCDCNHDVMSFITAKLSGIRRAIDDFYSSFTLLGSTQSVVSKDTTVKEALVTAEFLNTYDSQAATISELPPQPQRADYSTLGAYLKANAEWSILSKRFTLLRSQLIVKPAGEMMEQTTMENCEAGEQS